MVCNPSEETTGTFNPKPGQQVWVKMQSANPINPGFWGPGDFGLLDLPSGQQGANAIQNAFAKKNPFTGCYGNEVSTAPGQKGSVSDGVNTRLDIYVQSAKSYANDKDAYPAYNATKGLVWDQRLLKGAVARHPRYLHRTRRQQSGDGRAGSISPRQLPV